MIRVAILENERTAKDILYELGQLFQDQEWLFRTFLKASQLAHAQQREHFDIVILNGMFSNVRAQSVFVDPFEDRVVLYVCHDAKTEKLRHKRVFYLSSDMLCEELRGKRELLLQCVRGKAEYIFSYNNVKVFLSMNDIYYLSKEDKLVQFHTRRGTFSERASMNDMEKRFTPYGFERIHASFLVNLHHVFSVEGDTVVMDQQDQLPLSRSRKQKFLGVIERREQS